MVLLPRSLLRESDALDAEHSMQLDIDSITKSVGDTFASIMPKPKAPEPAPMFPQIDDSILEQPVQGPAPVEMPRFELPDDSTFLGTREPEPVAPAPTMGAAPITGSESVPSNGTAPVQRGPVGGDDPDSVRQYVRQAAQARGIDPSVAEKVMDSEGGPNPGRQSD
jgi:hypothetical protein